MTAAYSPELRALLAAERLTDAAAVAELQGDPKLARELYVRACAFVEAGRVAERTGELHHAAVHYAEGHALEAFEKLLPRLLGEPARVESIAFTLQQRGFDHACGLLLEASADHTGAARAFERAGDPLRAAAALERAGQWAQAGRLLEGALRRDSSRYDVALWLGELLVRCSKPEAALRVLQPIPSHARERRAALMTLAGAYERLGLLQAQAEVLAELQQLGPQSIRPSALPPARGTAPSQESVEAALLFGRYQSLEIVHESPSARVLRCVDSLRGDQVALKLFVGGDLHGTGRDAVVRFEREITVLRAIEHPHVVKPREYLPDGPALVTEWMAQGSLADLLAREPVAPRRAVEIAIAVLGALGQAHTLGILHRDLKPANVLFDAAGTPKLADFGVAHLGDLSNTVTAGLIGTFAYMSPEQRRGQPARVQSDLYGVGVMLFEMLTGTLPEQGDDTAKPSASHRELSEAHDSAVASLLGARPDDRPESATAAIRALTALSWPSLIDPVTVRRSVSERPDAIAIGSRRYERQADGRHVCSRSQRPVSSVTIGADEWARPRAFARCHHRAVQSVLTASLEQAQLWLDEPAHEPLHGPLTASELDTLREALTHLHALGYVQGRLDAEHLVRTATGPLLRYAHELPVLSDAETDWRALEQLTARSAS